MLKTLTILICIAVLILTSELRAQWVGTSLAYSGTHSLLPVGKFLFASSNGYLFRSSDNGNTWVESDNGISGTADIDRVILFGSDMVLTTGFAGIFRSSDTGKTWLHCLGKGPLNNGGASIIAMGDTLFVESTGALLRSYDEGEHWQLLPRLYGDTGIWCFHRSGSVLYAGADRGGVFRSGDRGQTWEGLTPWLKDTNVNAIETYGPYIFAGTRYAGIYRSSDSGVHWQRVNNGFSKVDVRGLIFVGDTLFAGFNHAGGVMLTTDFGDSWHNASQGLTDLNAFVFCVKDGYLFEGGGGSSGVWRRPLSEFSGVTLSQPAGLTLDQNFPNPFNPTTEIGYTLPKAGDVGFSVSDALGREVMSRHMEHETLGRHSISVDASKLPPGIYFYSIEFAAGRISRKMIVAK